MTQNSVLVIAESDESGADIGAALRDERWSVAVCHGVDDGLARLGKAPIDVLVVDESLWGDERLRGPAVGGASAPPVVVVTDEADEAGVLIGHLQLGAASYVPKAAAGPRLVQTVADLITLAGRNPLRDRLRPYMKSGRIEFELGNDLDNVPVTAAFVRMLMDNYALGDEKTRFRLCLALGEALSNAIIHGNLEIGSELREGQTDAYYKEIERRVGAEPWASRRVRLLFTFGPDEATLMVRDAGDGFDLEAVGDPTDPENLLKASGRGLLLMRAYTDSLEWNEAGNEVTLCKALDGGPGDGVRTSSGS